MQYPPLKAIEAVITKRVDGRTRRIATRYRGFFRCLDDQGQETSDPDEVVSVTLTPRAQDYWQASGGKSHIPCEASSSSR